MRVLRAAVQEHDVCGAVAPNERAETLAVTDVDGDTPYARRRVVRQAELLRVLVEETEFVVHGCWGHACSRPHAPSPAQGRSVARPMPSVHWRRCARPGCRRLPSAGWRSST